MSLYRLGYFFREAFKNILHSPVLTTISILTVAVQLELRDIRSRKQMVAGNMTVENNTK